MNTLIGPTDEQLDRMYLRLQQHIAGETSPASPAVRRQRPKLPRRRFIAASAAATAALVVTGVFIPQGHGHGDAAQAAEILNRAAGATVKTSDPSVAPGQYLRITTKSAYTSTVFHATGADTYYMIPTTGTLYVPSDRSQQWVWVRHNLPITTVFGTAAQKAQVKLGAPAPDPETEGTFRANAGAFYGTPAQNDHLSSQPRDPNALLKYFQDKYTGGAADENQQIWTEITDELRTGQVPADLRAALYKTAALIPGIAAIGTDVTLDGRTGVAIGRADSDIRDDIIIDPISGLMIGERTVALHPSAGIPVGTSIAWTSISTAVVNAAP